MNNNDVTLIIARQREPDRGEFAGTRDKWSGPPDVEAVPRGEPDERTRALAHLAWLLPTLVMAAIGLIGLDRPGLWADEFATWGFAVTPWSEFYPLLRDFDAVLGPYYALIHLWGQLAGTSDFALRLPSVLFMAGTAGMVSALATRIAGPRAGIIAGLLFAIVPTTTRYGQEARPYALAMFAATLATLLLVRVLDRPGWLRFTWYALALWLLGLSHVVALLMVVVHGVVVLSMRQRAAWGWLAAVVVGVVPGAALAYAGNAQSDQISWIPEVTLSRVGMLPEDLFGSALLGGALVGLGLMSLSLTKRGILFTLWALVPPACVYAIGAFTPLWLSRYLLFTIPAWIMLAATALARSLVMRAFAALLALTLLAMPTHVAVRAADGHGQDSKSLAATLATQMRPGDAIVYGPNGSGEGRVGRDLVARYVPADRRPADVLVRRPLRTDGHIMASECADVSACLNGVDRLWIIRTVPGRPDPFVGIGEAKETTLRQLYSVERTWTFKGLLLCLAVRKPTRPPIVPR